LKRYDAQKNRGRNGFGFYIPKTDRLTHNTKESRILSLLRKQDAPEVLMHHRLPTSTPNVRNACHPFSTKDVFENQYVVIHNGMVWNSQTLRKTHEELGIKYVSVQDETNKFNDSEALTYDLARYFEGQVDHLTASGSIAFIVIKRNADGKPMTLFFGRNTSPLKMKHTKHSLTLSSEGEGVDVKPHTLYSYSYDTGELFTTKMTIPGGYSSSPRNSSVGYRGASASAGRTASSTTSTTSRSPVSVTSVPSAANGWDDTKDIHQIEAKWKQDAEVKEAREVLLMEAGNDTIKAINLAQDKIKELALRMSVIEEADNIDRLENDDDELHELETHGINGKRAQRINEYVTINDKHDILQYALKYLEDDLIAEKVQLHEAKKKAEEGTAQQQIGFHVRTVVTPPSSPTVIKTGERHAVPNTKRLGPGTGIPYSD